MKRVYDRMIKKYDGSEVEFTFDDERPIQEQINKGCKYKKATMFHVPKLHSSIFKEYKNKNKWIVNATYEELMENGGIASLADNQMLETLREISGHPFNHETYSGLKNALRVAEKNGNIDSINRIKEEIVGQQYMPDYLIIVFDEVSHYKKLFKYEETSEDNKIKELRFNLPEHDEYKIDKYKEKLGVGERLIFNGKTYTRLTCGAAQARKSIVVFCNEEYTNEVLDRLNADRDINARMAASKFNAYLGLYSSASRKVTMPRIAVIGAYETEEIIHTMYEVPWDKVKDDNGKPKYKNEKEYFEVDSKLEEKIDKVEKFNRFDGGGIIRPEMALQWAYDLGLDYVPANFCIRYTFTKGAVACFDFVKWCAEKNNGNYIMKDIFGNEFDVREKDIIITEDMAKMINQWDSVEHYIECSEKAGNSMRVTKYAPKEDVVANTLNYQYIQTLNWKNGIDENDNKVFPDNWEWLVKNYGYKKACELTGCDDGDLYGLAKKTINHYKDVLNDPIKSRLFLTGKASNPIEVLSEDDPFNKSLLLFPGIMNSSKAKRLIRDMISKSISNAKLGHAIERGNYQCLVPDSYAFCEFMAGREVKGLIPKREDGVINCYSAFWNNLGIDKVALARSPQTYRSEWVKCNLINNAETNKWFMHQYSGFITPIYGTYTLELAGSDFDYDIGYTTDDKIIFNKIYEGKPVTSYDVPKPAKIDLKTNKYSYTLEEKKSLNVKNMKDELREMDTKSFGQEIGRITNYSTSFYCMQTRFKEGSEPYRILESRLQQLCIAQSKQIDKTKIGKEVKSIPSAWFEEGEANLPSTKAKPYFMIYRYDELNKYYKTWRKQVGLDNPYNPKAHYEKKDFVLGLNGITIPNLDSKKLTKEGWDNYYKNNKPDKDYTNLINSCEDIMFDPCPMNRFCWYIESELSNEELDRKGENRNNRKFDWRIMLSDIGVRDSDYQIVKKIMDNKTEFINNSDILRNSKIKDEENNTILNLSKIKYLEALKYELLKKVGNIDMVINCLVKYFFAESADKSTSIFWEMVGEEAFNNMLNNVDTVVVPIKDPNGNIDYLYNNYSMRTLTVKEIREKYLRR